VARLLTVVDIHCILVDTKKCALRAVTLRDSNEFWLHRSLAKIAEAFAEARIRN
jgi:hypothetical protein